ncbi:MAPEG family protein [Shewanella youngdeokensis]|uniref:MAPEG family protein n=1 Tax=Shewanella youngdeokensis TaxID=2999068 RepID=A0ABZ0JYF9_9GAMM|nr:MAPEG family protein [Shewanella sp. DAU334]
MMLSTKQSGVLKGMLLAMVTSIGGITAAIIYDPFQYAGLNVLSERLTVLGLALILPTLLLIVSVGRLAKFRFFSPDDIDGSGLTPGSHDAVMLQSLLQNTLEQCVIAFAVYTAWVLLMPSNWLSVVPLCSILFAVGRIGFFVGYRRGAPARAFGFALTFYSTVVMFLVLLGYQLA